MVSQAMSLSKKPHIVIGTPGRVVDHLSNTKGFNLKNLKFLIFDEADRLLDLDFEKQIHQLLAVIPKTRTTFLFSATMTSKVHKLQKASLIDPVKIEINTKYKTVNTLVQNYLFIPAKYKETYLSYILKEQAGSSIIVFVGTCLGSIQ
jgi:ATP-dependent RNA helicase DDX47/RRP3